jgi:hypothetical protein
MESESGINEEQHGEVITDLSDIRVGAVLEAQDKFGSWFLAHVIKIDEELSRVLVHFKGWGPRFDEWVGISSNRLRHESSNPPQYRGGKNSRKVTTPSHTPRLTLSQYM